MGAGAARDLTNAFAQRPQLFIVEVGISLNAFAAGPAFEPMSVSL